MSEISLVNRSGLPEKLKFVITRMMKSKHLCYNQSYILHDQLKYLYEPSTFGLNPALSDYQYIIHTADIKLIQQPSVLTLNYDKVICVGDIHANYESLINFLYSVYEDETLPENHSILFLGDIIDRGNNTVLCVYLVYLLIIMFDNIFIIRGNHEDESRYFNLIAKEIESNLADVQSRNSFVHIPIAAIINNDIFAVHGCIPHHGFREYTTRNEMIQSIDKMNVKRPDLMGSWKNVSDEYLMVWSDPVSMKDVNLSRVCDFPTRGNFITQVDTNIIKEFMEKFGFKLIIRGHQFYKSGFAYLNLSHPEQSTKSCLLPTIPTESNDLIIVTLSSSKNYCETPSNAAKLNISEKEIDIEIFDPCY